MGVTRGLYQGISMGFGATIIPKYYGRAHLGEIQGFYQSVMMAGTALGPLVLGTTAPAPYPSSAGL